MGKTMFQSLIGSLSTRRRHHAVFPLLKFQSLIGSLSTGDRVRSPGAAPPQFQSLIGSLSTPAIFRLRRREFERFNPS